VRFRNVAAAITATAAAAAIAIIPTRQELVLDRRELPADGRSIARARAKTTSVLGIETFDPPNAKSIAWDMRETNALGVKVLKAHDGELVFRSGTKPGVLTLALGDKTAAMTLVLNTHDTDEDGLPDAAELLSREDRAAFVTWFTAIAEAQATAIDDAWPAIHQDCAGLVRFAYKEALRAHDRAWLDKRRHLPRLAAPDVAAFHYPSIPFLGDRLFRNIGGRFDARRSIEEQYTAAATARVLYDLNSSFISRDIQEARAGDLLFYALPNGTGSRMHTMIVLGPRPGASLDDHGTRVVYHTGTSETGEVRLVALEHLLEHPDASWHPRAHNPRFLGVHRLALLVHDSIALGALP
jgi:uncharacterized protein